MNVKQREICDGTFPEGGVTYLWELTKMWDEDGSEMYEVFVMDTRQSGKQLIDVTSVTEDTKLVELEVLVRSMARSIANGLQ